MKPWELTASLQQRVAPVYQVTGEEDFLRDEAVAAIQHAVLGAGDDGSGLAPFNAARLYGDETDAAEILAAAAEAPVFATQRVVLVKAADKLPAREGEAVIPYLKNPCESTVLVFTGVKVDGRTKFGQALKEAAVVVDCSPLPDAQLSGWVQAQANRLGLRLTAAAVQLLMDLGGLYGIRGELEKLAAFVPAGQTADMADVERIKGGEPGASVFDLAEAIGRQDRERVLRILRRNVEAGEAPLRILGSLAWQYRRLWRVKELSEERQHEGQIAKAVGLPPFRVREMLGQVRFYPTAHLRRALAGMFDTDSALKGGSAGAGERVLERLLLRLCDDLAEATGARQGPARAGHTAPPPAPAGPRTRTISNVRSVRPGQPPRR